MNVVYKHIETDPKNERKNIKSIETNTQEKEKKMNWFLVSV